MEEKVRELETVLAELKYQLEMETVQEIRFVVEQGVLSYRCPERTALECEIRFSRMRARELRAKVLVAHAKLAQLKVAAEQERLRSLGRPPTAVELERLLRLTRRAMRDQRKQAARLIRRATNSDRACERVEGTRPMPSRDTVTPSNEQVERQQQQEHLRQGRRR
jgi:hypothetical protein